MSLMADVVLSVLLVYIVHSILSWLLNKYQKLQTFKKLSIPGPKPHFFMGNFSEYIYWPHHSMDRWFKKYGEVFGYFQGSSPVLVLSDIDDVQEVLVKMGRKFVNRQMPIINVPPFDASLLNIRGERWKNSRKILTPPFTVHKLSKKGCKDIIQTAVERMLGSIEKNVKQGKPIDISNPMKNVTLDVICRMAFNMDNNDVHEENSELREMTTQFMERTTNVAGRLVHLAPILKQVALLYYQFFSNGRFLNTMLEHLHNSIVKHYQQKLELKFSPEKEQEDNRMNILDYMLEQQELGNLTENELLGNSIVVLLAGYETTATALTFTMYLLAKHQNIQHKLRKELKSMYRPELNCCQFDDFRCELMDRVWHESMRLYPPVVAFVMRELDDNIEEVTLTKSGLTITKNLTVQVPVWSIHHNPKHWPDPFKFDPYRENLPVPGTSIKNNAFLTFGNGPRFCIGGTLALNETRAVLSSLLLKYHFELASELKADPKTGLIETICPTVVIHPKDPIYLKLTPL